MKEIVKKTSEHLHELQKVDGLGNCFIDPYSGD